MRIIFQGDSITDGGRNINDLHSLGWSYPRFVAPSLQELYKDLQFEFINRGVSGNQTIHLLERTQQDIIDLEPDIVSILIGINDVWYYANRGCNFIPHEIFEQRYRNILTAIKQKTDAKILILEPYLLPVPDKQFFRIDLDPKIQIVRKLAREYADIFVPTDGLFAAATVEHTCEFFSGDGVHPNENGAQFIAKNYVDAIKTLL